MNQQSRLQNVLRNMKFGIGCRLIDFIFNFAVRILFVRILGQEILGINGLFTNILTWLSLADLGFGTAMSFSFYKPLAEKDIKTLSALTFFYQKVYRIIMLAVLIIGLSMVPFLHLFVRTDQEIPYLTSYYLLLLFHTASSYLFVYKASILRADQNEYVISFCNTIFNFLKTFVQILFLLFYKNYHIFLLIQVIFTIFNNLFISSYANKKYSFIKEKIELEKEEKQKIFKNVFSVLIYKISSILLNGTDNVLISMIVGTVFVGYYSNYLFAIHAITGFVTVIFSSFYGSLGNLLHTSSKRQSKEVFESLLYFGYFLGCITSACFLGVFQDFIIIFFGSNYLLSYATMLVIVGNYYLSCICQPIWTFRETSGLFSKVKYIMGITAIINLVLSIFLGYCWGIFGILLASAISRLLTYFWYEPKLIYQDFFQSSVSQYFSFILKYFIISILAILPAIFMSRFYNNSLLVLLLKLFTSGFCSVFIFILLTKENESFKKMKSIVLKKLRNKI